MNAGAYGGEMSDCVVSVTYIDEAGDICVISKNELDFGYRHSYFSDKNCIIISAEIRLKKGDKNQSFEKINEFQTARKEKQPLEYPSAGSTFKRPVGYFAGALIEQCGFKGKSLGGAQISDKHAGFLINKDNATAKDILDLINLTQETVKKETGVTLEPEVIILR
jgi:UDP-N-acetylmuramate dehydrogenase